MTNPSKSRKKGRNGLSRNPIKIEPDDRWVLIGLIGLYLLTVMWGLLSDATWDDDCATRYYLTRHAFEDPTQFINVWNRPLFVLLFAIPLQLGQTMVVFQMALISVVGCYALYRGARELNIPNAYLIIPFPT